MTLCDMCNEPMETGHTWCCHGSVTHHVWHERDCARCLEVAAFAEWTRSGSHKGPACRTYVDHLRS